LDVDQVPESAFPVIVKPLESLDSRSVSKAGNREELIRACKRVFTERTKLPGDHGFIPVEEAYGMRPIAVVETYVEGPEYSAEVIVVGGKIRNSFVTFKRNTGPPYFIERGYSSGLETLTQEQKRELRLLTESLIFVNGYVSTILHVEFKITQGGAVFLIECNSRLCGDQIGDLTERAWGTNVLDAFFRYLDGESNSLYPEEPVLVASRFYLTSTVEGYLSIQKKELAGHKIDWWKEEGDQIRHLASTGITRVGCCTFNSLNAQDLAQTEAEIKNEIDFCFKVNPTVGQSIADFLSSKIKRAYFWALTLLSVILVCSMSLIAWQEYRSTLLALGKDMSHSLLSDVVDGQILPIAQRLKKSGFIDLANHITVTDPDFSVIYTTDQQGLPNRLVYQAINKSDFSFLIPIEADGINHGYLLFDGNSFKFWFPLFGMGLIVFTALFVLYLFVTRRVVPEGIRASEASISQIFKLVVTLNKELAALSENSSAQEFELLERAQRDLKKLPVEFTEVKALQEVANDIITALRAIRRDIEERASLRFNCGLLKQDMIREREKREAVSEVSKQVAHDIRSPLVALKLATKDLRELPEDIRLLIQSATSRINDIANDLVTKHKQATQASSANGGTPSAVFAFILIDSLVSEKRMQYKSKPAIKIDYEVRHADRAVFVWGHSAELKRVISNIINNAYEALEDTGEILVQLERIKNEVRISIRDTGRGMPSEIVDQVVQSGFTYGKKDGSGLGLYHAKSYLTTIGGGLEVKSSFGSGTEIVIRLKVSESPLYFISALSVVAGSRIVILDDDPSIHEVWDQRFGELKNRPQLKIFHFLTATDLLFWVGEQSTTEDCLFLIDLELLGDQFDGLYLIEKMKIVTQAILVTSRHEEMAVIDRCTRLGVRLLPKLLSDHVEIRVVRDLHSSRDIPVTLQT